MHRRIERWNAGRVACVPWLAIAVVLAAGCGMERQHPVSGEVQFEGRPVEVGQITFQPSGQFSGDVTAADILDGQFELSGPDGLAAGRYRARITAMRKREQNSHGLGLTDPPLALPEQYIPAKYNEQTTLEVEVTPDSMNHFVFDLNRGK